METALGTPFCVCSAMKSQATAATACYQALSARGRGSDRLPAGFRCPAAGTGPQPNLGVLMDVSQLFHADLLTSICPAAEQLGYEVLSYLVELGHRGIHHVDGGTEPKLVVRGTTSAPRG